MWHQHRTIAILTIIFLVLAIITARQAGEGNLGFASLSSVSVGTLFPLPSIESGQRLVSAKKQICSRPSGEKVRLTFVQGESCAFLVDVPPSNSSASLSAIYHNGNKSAEYVLVSELGVAFSPDGRHFAYTASTIDDFKQVSVYDGVEGPRYSWVGRPRFSADGTEHTYVARPTQSDDPVVVRDGRLTDEVIDLKCTRFPSWYEVRQSEARRKMASAPNGLHVATVRHGSPVSEQCCTTVAVDGRVHKTYGPVSFLRFSPDSRYLAYVARDESGSSGAFHVVINGNEGPSWDEIYYLEFAQKGNELRYAARKGEDVFLITEIISD